MATKIFQHRYSVEGPNGLISNDVHNWDGKTFDKDGYPVADCGARLYPRNLGYDGQSNVCKDCFK